ncbi:MAG: ATP-binding protein [Chloroflexi bacterium]|nr:ATP-binding protein [Chloroflexota bacterium]
MSKMQFDFDGLIQLLAQNLYSEKHVFIRELIQNSHDAIVRRRHQEGETYQGKISIDTRPDELLFVIKDTGIGMSKNDLDDYLSTVGKGATREAKTDGQIEGLIGLFGIGFLSAFVVAKRVEVRTRRLGESEGWLWQNEGKQEYAITPCSVEEQGTTVTIFLRGEEEKGVIHHDEVRSVIRRYADFLRVPIYLNSSSDAINAMRMPWEQAGRGDMEIDLDTHIYLEKTMRDSVLEQIPINLPELETTGALYITRSRRIQRQGPRAVRLFVNRMYICEKETDLLPEWADFINGVICVSDKTLTLTAARDNFIRDPKLKRLQTALGDVVIRHLETLSQEKPDLFSKILSYHDLSIKAACFYHDEFFGKFADLLEWRTNKGEPTTYAGDFTHEWRTLPKILALLPKPEGEPQPLPYFNDHNSTNQYFQMADAAGSLVVDASYSFEVALLKAYAKRAEGRIRLMPIDQEDDPHVFRALEDDIDGKLKLLSEYMSQVIRPGGTGRLRVEAKYFEPKELTAIIRTSAASDGQIKAREILNDPTSSTELREMAREMMLMAHNVSRRVILNAGNPMVRKLALQNFENQNVYEIMLGIYNSAILYNQELMTPQHARIFYEDFQRLLTRSLDYVVEKTTLERREAALAKEHESLRKHAEPKDQPKHLIFFLMTPFDPAYKPFVQTMREVVENRFACQLFVANDRQYEDTIIENVRFHMNQAHAFLAEVTAANPNVMFELGAARFNLRDRPIVLLRQNSTQQLPADLQGRIYVDYGDGMSGELADYIEEKLRADERIKLLLNQKGREHYISATILKQFAGTLGSVVEDKVWAGLAEKYPTREAWGKASLDSIQFLIKENEDLAEPIFRRIRTGVLQMGA